LLSAIEGLINVQFDDLLRKKENPDDLTPMFTQTIPNFMLFLHTEFFPKINKFRFESSVYVSLSDDPK